MSDRPGVVMLMDGPFPTSSGGAESQVQTLGERMVDLGVRVLVLAIRQPQRRKVERHGRLIVYQLDVIPLRFLAGLSLLFATIRFLLVNRHRYGTVHVHKAHYVAALMQPVARLLGKKILVKVTGWSEMENGVLNPRHRGPYWWLLRSLLRHARFQATSEAISKQLSAMGVPKQQIFRVPNAVDVARFTPNSDKSEQRIRLGIADIRSAVFVGRLVPEKGLDSLLTAWHESGANDRCQLLIVGDGHIEQDFRTQIADLGLGRVYMVGACQDIEKYLACADFAVLPSRFEGLSNSLLEYMAAGLPVIGTRVSGTEDLIDRSCGWLTEPDDLPAMEAALREAFETDIGSLRTMGEHSRQKIVAYASADSVLKKLLTAYGLGGLVRGSAG